MLYSKGNYLLEYLTGFIFLKKDTIENYGSQTHIIINVINVLKKNYEKIKVKITVFYRINFFFFLKKTA